MPEEPQSERTVVLWHGTTRKRAERILAIGPDPTFHEPGESRRKFGEEFAMTESDRDVVGSAEEYARGKANLFPNEGGPVIVEVEFRESFLDATDDMGYWQFVGPSLTSLIRAWPNLVKRIVPL